MSYSLFLSGGPVNTVTSLSLGGVVSSAFATRQLFPLTTAQFASGAVLHRCGYLQTTVAVDRLSVWVATDTPVADISVGWGAAAIDGTEPAVASELIAPAGVTFSSATSLADAVSGGDFSGGQRRAVWIRYTVLPNAPILLESFSLAFVEGPAAGSLNLNNASNSQYLGFF